MSAGDPTTAAGPSGTFWLPPQASTHAVGTDGLLTVLFGLSLFVLALIVGAPCSSCSSAAETCTPTNPRQSAKTNGPCCSASAFPR